MENLGYTTTTAPAAPRVGAQAASVAAYDGWRENKAECRGEGAYGGLSLVVLTTLYC